MTFYFNYISNDKKYKYEVGLRSGIFVHLKKCFILTTICSNSLISIHSSEATAAAKK